MKKLVIATFVSIALLLVAGSYVFASECFVVKKPDGAGNIGDVIIDVSGTGNPDIEPTNGGGKTKGGFVDVWLDTTGDGEGNIRIQNDTFLLPSAPGLPDPIGPQPNHLPEGAMNSGGPGKGIDENHP